ncbi:MAG: DUF892 family protein [Steroidobacteraceae bacterium]
MAQTNNNSATPLVGWLRDAHAMERASADNLDRIAARLSRPLPLLATRLQQHCRETQEQITRIEQNLERLGSDRSLLKDTATRLRALAEGFATLVAADEPIKDCLAAYSVANYELGAYIALGEAAKLLQDPLVERMCELHLATERQFAAYLEQQIIEVTRDYLQP